MIDHHTALAFVPEGLTSAEAAPLLCAGVTTYNSLRHTDAKPGDVVAVQGIGGLGHLAIQFAAKAGFKVVAISAGDSKRDLALSLGASAYINSSKQDAATVLSEMGGAAVIMCTAPNGSIIGPLAKGLAIDGVVMVLAAAGPIQVDSIDLIMKRCAFRGWASGTAIDSEETMRFAQLAKVSTMVKPFSFPEQVNAAYDEMMSNTVRFRSVIVFK